MDGRGSSVREMSAPGKSARRGARLRLPPRLPAGVSRADASLADAAGDPMGTVMAADLMCAPHATGRPVTSVNDHDTSSQVQARLWETGRVPAPLPFLASLLRPHAGGRRALTGTRRRFGTRSGHVASRGGVHGRRRWIASSLAWLVFTQSLLIGLMLGVQAAPPAFAASPDEAYADGAYYVGAVICTHDAAGERLSRAEAWPPSGVQTDGTQADERHAAARHAADTDPAGSAVPAADHHRGGLLDCCLPGCAMLAIASATLPTVDPLPFHMRVDDRPQPVSDEAPAPVASVRSPRTTRGPPGTA